MKSTAKYIVRHIERLEESQSLEQRLVELKSENRTHFVITNTGKVITLKDATENNTDDSLLGMSCVHVLILTPKVGINNTLTLLAHLRTFFKNVSLLVKQLASYILLSEREYLNMVESATSSRMVLLDLFQCRIEQLENQVTNLKIDLLTAKISQN